MARLYHSWMISRSSTSLWGQRSVTLWSRRASGVLALTLPWVFGCPSISLVRQRWRSALWVFRCLTIAVTIIMDSVLTSRDNLKLSKVSGLIWVWPQHYQQYCHYVRRGDMHCLEHGQQIDTADHQQGCHQGGIHCSIGGSGPLG